MRPMTNDSLAFWILAVTWGVIATVLSLWAIDFYRWLREFVSATRDKREFDESHVVNGRSWF